MERKTVEIHYGKQIEKGVFDARLVLPANNRFDVRITDPFLQEGEIEADQEKRLRWYFEEYYKVSFSGGHQAKRTEKSIEYYGETLFKQLFAQPEALLAWHQLAGGLDELRIQIVGDEPAFHALHWEALKDPNEKKPCCLMGMEIFHTSDSPTANRPIRESSCLNLLLVTARPRGKDDVEYRTLTRPIVETLDDHRMPVCVNLLRPPTLAALKEHLRRRKGFYHIVHFDVHGAVMPNDNDGETRAFILLHHPEGGADRVPAETVAELLRQAHVPVCFLNACQSAKSTERVKEGQPEGEREFVLDASLAMELLEQDVQLVLGMGWSLTVDAARVMMPVLYRSLTGGEKPGAALNRARLALAENNTRNMGGGTSIQLQDWLLPVVWGKGDFSLALQLKPRSTEELAGDAAQQEELERLEEEIKTTGQYGFLGRDVDILTIERMLQEDTKGSNILLIRGMGGTGKTTLMGHMALWWLKTGWLDEVFYFTYDRKPYHAEEILNTVAEKVMPRDQYGQFLAMGDTGKKAFLLADFLKPGKDTPRVLLALDNMESITGAEQAIGGRLEKEQQELLATVLKRLMKSSIKILLGSRAPEKWLAPKTFKDRVYVLEGLDIESRYALAGDILKKEDISIDDAEGFKRLMKVLAGYPLAMEIILPDLAVREPAELVKLLTGEGIDLEGKSISDEEEIFKCIDISYSLLDAQAQSALRVFSPFTGLLNAMILEEYLTLLHRHGGFKDLTLTDLEEALSQAQTRGLIQEKYFEGCYAIQPVLPFFLAHGAAQRAKLSEEDANALDAAFCDYMSQLARDYKSLMQSNKAKEKQAGKLLFKIERENLGKALSRVLERQGDFYPLYAVFNTFYFDNPHHFEAISWMEGLAQALDEYVSKDGDFLGNYASVVGNLGTQYMAVKDYDRAEAQFKKSLGLLLGAGKRQSAAGLYHQLGMVAQEQRDFDSARDHYNQALTIYMEFNDRYEQAGTYHQSGRVAQEQRNFDSARDHYNQALTIYMEFNDRYEQAGTYHQLGGVAQEQQDFDSARHHYNQALMICIEFKDHYNQARIYHQLGMVAQQQQDFDSARDHYNQALTIFKEFNDRYSQASTYHQLGRVADEEKDYLQALSHYALALEIWKEFKDEYNRGKVTRNLKLLFEAWDEGDARKGIGTLNAGDEIKKELLDILEAAGKTHEK